MEAIMILPILVRCTFEAVLLNFFRFTLQCDVLVVLARNRSVSLTKRPQQQQQNKVIKNNFAILQLWCWSKLSVCLRALGSLELTVSPIIFYLISVIDRPCIFLSKSLFTYESKSVTNCGKLSSSRHLGKYTHRNTHTHTDWILESATVKWIVHRKKRKQCIRMKCVETEKRARDELHTKMRECSKSLWATRKRDREESNKRWSEPTSWSKGAMKDEMISN